MKAMSILAAAGMLDACNQLVPTTTPTPTQTPVATTTPRPTPTSVVTNVVRLAQTVLPNGEVGRGYWAQPAVTGGVPPYSWSTQGIIPEGFSLSKDGQLTGMPGKQGENYINAYVADATGVLSRLMLPVKVVDKSDLSDYSISGTVNEDGNAEFHYDPYIPAFRNPLEGMRPYVSSARTHPWASLARQYIEWNRIENKESDTIDKIKEVTDALIGDLPAYNIKIVPRVYLFWPPDKEYWPSDLTPGDYTSPAFRSRMVRLIARLGEAWDKDPRIAFIEMGIIGYWGEQHDPSFGAIEGNDLPKYMEPEFADAFVAAFPNKLLMHRDPGDFEGYGFGIHWDTFGSFDLGFWANTSTGMTEALSKPGWNSLWKSFPMGGEIDPTFLGEPDFSESSMQDVVKRYSERLIGLIQKLHWNHLGVLESVDRFDEDLWENASRLQNALGYRFVIDQASYTSRVSPSGNLEIHLSIRNVGSSPFYYHWPLELSLLSPDNRRPVWKALLEDIGPRGWLPNVSLTINEKLDISAGLPAGRYVLALSILDPAGMVPAIRFAVRNYYNGGRTPLGPIGLNTDPGPLTLNDFDDIQSDNSLYYLPGS